METTLQRKPILPKYLSIPLLAAALIVMFAQVGRMGYIGIDFGYTFYPVAHGLLEGQNPYTTSGYYNPPWIAVLLAPLGSLSMPLAWSIFLVLGISGYGIAYHHMEATWPEIALLMLSPFTIIGLMYGNIDWLVLLGVGLPPVYGLWLLAAKPQMTIVLWAVVMLRLHKRSQDWQMVPVIAALGLSWVMGWWQIPRPGEMNWSADVWPWGLPVGLALAFIALRRLDTRLALAAAPFLSPYVAIHSWIVILFPLLGHRKLLLGAVLLAWVWALYRLTISPG